MKSAYLLCMATLLSGCALEQSGFWDQTPHNVQMTHSEPAQERPLDKRQAFEAKLSSWTGHDINELIARTGAPTSTYRMPNGHILYTYFNSIVVPSTIGMGPMELTCTVNYEVDGNSGLVIGNSYKGCVY